jgi:hypothetical protein
MSPDPLEARKRAFRGQARPALAQHSSLTGRVLPPSRSATPQPALDHADPEHSSIFIHTNNPFGALLAKASAQYADDIAARNRMRDKALLCMYPDHPFRVICTRVREHVMFDRFIMLIIAANSVFLCMYDPLDQPQAPDPRASSHNQMLYVADLVFTVLYTLEAIIKVSSMGLYFHDRAYLRDTWNQASSCSSAHRPLAYTAAFRRNARALFVV